MVPMTPIVEKKTILFGSKKDCHISSFVFLSYTILWMFWKVMMPNFFHVVEFDKPWNWLVRICHKNGQQQDRLNTQKHLFSFFSLSSSIFLEMSTVFNQQFSISSRKKCANAYSFHIRVFHGYMPQNLKHKLPMYVHSCSRKVLATSIDLKLLASLCSCFCFWQHNWALPKIILNPCARYSIAYVGTQLYSLRN
jgi:hypothetical protein